MIDDDLIYKDVKIAKASVEFSGSEKLEKARRTFLVFLTIVLFIEFANIEVKSATLAVVVAKVGRPWVVTAGLWLLFIYSFAVYYFAVQKELAFFAFKNAKKSSFFSQLNRLEFTRRLVAASGCDYLQPGQGLVIKYDESVTEIQYDVDKLPEDDLKKIDGFEYSTRTFTYTNQPDDHAYFAKVVPLIRPAFCFNYLVYVLPIHVGFVLAAFGLLEQCYALFDYLA
ncbi:MAG: hypothetical protein NPIRA03_36370 [Nitrospirales bacterium]|nr:MAG: hypothetical protein NPIRA03_36370 [Nitrospirales bacterium]